jgi:CspA family cold shock protein
MANNQTYNGVVKWFNSQTGFGFITDIEADTDIFVHHSSITLQTDNTWKSLVQGEYVQFELTTDAEDGKVKAVNVTGFGGGKLLCEHPSNKFLLKQHSHANKRPATHAQTSS